MTLKLWEGETDFVIAESPEDATKVLQEWNGPTWSPEPYESLEEVTASWTAFDDEREFKLDDDGVRTVMLAREWVKTRGRCYLGSTEY